MFNLPIESAVLLSHRMIWVMMVRDTDVVTESRVVVLSDVRPALCGQTGGYR